MGDMVSFPSNGKQASGYLVLPAGPGPGVIVIQEWWGLVPHIKTIADRFAREGFVALAPDLYHGQATTSPDQAGRLMMALRIDEAEQDLRGAVQSVKDLEARLKALGKRAEMHIYPGAQHAFFNDERPEVYDRKAAEDAWDRTVKFFTRELGAT